MAQIPPNLMEVMKELSKYIVKDKPDNVYQYAFEFFNKKIIERDGHLHKNYEIFQEQQLTENGNICKYILNKKLISGNKKKILVDKSQVNNEKLLSEKISSSKKQNQRNYVIENASNSVKIKNFQNKSDSKSSLLDETIIEEDSNAEDEEANRIVASNNKKNKSLEVLTNEESEKKVNANNLVMGPAAVAATAGIITIGISNQNSDKKHITIENTEITNSAVNENVDFVNPQNNVEENYESIKKEDLDSELPDSEIENANKVYKSVIEIANAEIVDKENLVTGAADLENTNNSYSRTQNELLNNKVNNLNSSNNGDIGKEDHDDDSNEHVNLELIKSNINEESDKTESGIIDTVDKDKSLNSLNTNFSETDLDNTKENLNTLNTELFDSNSEKTVIEKKLTDLSESSKNEIGKGNGNDLDISNEKKINSLINALDENNKLEENIVIADLNLEHPIPEKNSIDTIEDSNYTRDEVDTGNLNHISENKPKSLHERDLNILYDAQTEEMPEIHQTNIEPQASPVMEPNLQSKKISKRSIDFSKDLDNTYTEADSAEELKILNNENELRDHQKNNDISHTEPSELNLEQGLGKIGPENNLNDSEVNVIKEEPANTSDIKLIDNHQKELNNLKDVAQNMDSNTSLNEEPSKIENISNDLVSNNEPDNLENVKENIDKLVLLENQLQDSKEILSGNKRNIIDPKSFDLDDPNSLCMEKNENEKAENESINFSHNVLDTPIVYDNLKNDPRIPTENLENMRNYDSQINSMNKNVKIEIRPTEKNPNPNNENLVTIPENVKQNNMEEEKYENKDIDDDDQIESKSNFENRNANDKEIESNLDHLSNENENTEKIESPRKNSDTALSELPKSNLDNPILEKSPTDLSEDSNIIQNVFTEKTGNESENAVHNELNTSQNVETLKQNRSNEDDNYLLTRNDKDSNLNLLHDRSPSQNSIDTIVPTLSKLNSDNLTLKNNSIDLSKDLTTVHHTKEASLNIISENKSENLILNESNPNVEFVEKDSGNEKGSKLSNNATTGIHSEHISKEVATAKDLDDADLSKTTESNTDNSLLNESSIDPSKDSNIIENEFLEKNSNTITENASINLIRNKLNDADSKVEATSQENLNQDYHNENDAVILSPSDIEADPSQLINKVKNLHKNTDVLSDKIPQQNTDNKIPGETIIAASNDLNLTQKERSKNNFNNISGNTSTEDNPLIENSPTDLSENLTTIHKVDEEISNNASENKTDNSSQEEVKTKQENLYNDNGLENDNGFVILNNKKELEQSDNEEEKPGNANKNSDGVFSNDSESNLNSSTAKDNTQLLLSEAPESNLDTSALKKNSIDLTEDLANVHKVIEQNIVPENLLQEETTKDQENLNENNDHEKGVDLIVPNNKDESSLKQSANKKEAPGNSYKNPDAALSEASESTSLKNPLLKEDAEPLLSKISESNLENPLQKKTLVHLSEDLVSVHGMNEDNSNISPENIKHESLNEDKNLEKNVNVLTPNKDSENEFSQFNNENESLEHSDKISDTFSEIPESHLNNSSLKENTEAFSSKVPESNLENQALKTNSSDFDLSEDLATIYETKEDDSSIASEHKSADSILDEIHITQKSPNKDNNSDSENNFIQLSNQNKKKISDTVLNEFPESHINTPIPNEDAENLLSELPKSNLVNQTLEKNDLSEHLTNVHNINEENINIAPENKPRHLIQEELNVNPESLNKGNDYQKEIDFTTPNNKDSKSDLSQLANENRIVENINIKPDAESYLYNPTLKENSKQLLSKVPKTYIDNPILTNNSIDLSEDLVSAHETKEENSNNGPGNLFKNLIQEEISKTENLNQDNEHENVEFITPNNMDHNSNLSQLANGNDIEKKSDDGLSDISKSSLNKPIFEENTSLLTKSSASNLDNLPLEKSSIGCTEDLTSNHEINDDNSNIVLENKFKNLNKKEVNEKDVTSNNDHENIGPENDLNNLANKNVIAENSNVFLSKNTEELGIEDEDTNFNTSNQENKNNAEGKGFENNTDQLRSENENSHQNAEAILSNVPEVIAANSTLNTNLSTSTPIKSSNINQNEYPEVNSEDDPENLSLEEPNFANKDVEIPKQNSIKHPGTDLNQVKNENTKIDLTKLSESNLENIQLEKNSIDISNEVNADLSETTESNTDNSLLNESSIDPSKDSNIIENEFLEKNANPNNKKMNISDKNIQILKKDNSAENQDIEVPLETNLEKNMSISEDKILKDTKDITEIPESKDSDTLCSPGQENKSNLDKNISISEDKILKDTKDITEIPESKDSDVLCSPGQENKSNLEKNISISESKNSDALCSPAQENKSNLEKNISISEDKILKDTKDITEIPESKDSNALCSLEEENNSNQSNNENNKNGTAPCNNKKENNETFSPTEETINDEKQEKIFEVNNQVINKLSFEDTEDDVVIKAYQDDGQWVENDSPNTKMNELLPESEDNPDKEKSLGLIEKLQKNSHNLTQVPNDNLSQRQTEKVNNLEDLHILSKQNEILDNVAVFNKTFPGKENGESANQDNGDSSKSGTVPFEKKIPESEISSQNLKLVDNTSDLELQNSEQINDKPLNSNKKQDNNGNMQAVEESNDYKQHIDESNDETDSVILKNEDKSEAENKLVEIVEEPFQKTKLFQSTESNKMDPIKIVEGEEINSLTSNKDEINNEESFSDSLQNTDIYDEGSSLNNYDSLTGDNINDENSNLQHIDKIDNKSNESEFPNKDSILNENDVKKKIDIQGKVEIIEQNNLLKAQNFIESHSNNQQSEIEVKKDKNSITNQNKDKNNDELLDVLENKNEKDETDPNISTQIQKKSIEILNDELNIKTEVGESFEPPENALKEIIGNVNETDHFENINEQKRKSITDLSNGDDQTSVQNNAGNSALKETLEKQSNSSENKTINKNPNISGDDHPILMDTEVFIKDTEEKTNQNSTENSFMKSDEINSNINLLIESKENNNDTKGDNLNKTIIQDNTSSSHDSILELNKTNESNNESNEHNQEGENSDAIRFLPDNVVSVATPSNPVVNQEKFETDLNEVQKELRTQKSVEMNLQEAEPQENTKKALKVTDNENDIDKVNTSPKNEIHIPESDKIQVVVDTIKDTNTYEDKRNSSSPDEEDLSVLNINKDHNDALTENDQLDNIEEQRNEEKHEKIVSPNFEETKTSFQTGTKNPNLKLVATNSDNSEEKKLSSTDKDNLDQNAAIEKVIIKERFWQDTSPEKGSTLDTDDAIVDEKTQKGDESADKLSPHEEGNREESIKEILSKEKIRFKSPSDPVEVMDKLIDNDSEDIEDPSRYKPDSLEALYYNIKANNYLSKSKSLTAENLQDVENNFSLINSLNSGVEEEDLKNDDLSSKLESSASFDLENNMKVGNEIRSAIENVNDSSSLESTVTESTIINAVTKIQAVGRGYLTRLKLKRGDFGKSLPAKHYYKSYSADSLNLERRASKYDNVRKSNSWPEVKYSSEMKYLKRLDLNQKSNEYDEDDKPDDEKIAQSSALASRRLTLQRTDAVQINSTENTAEAQVELKKKVVIEKDNEKKWLMIRQCTMPVQIDAEILRLMPKHLRKRIRSADTEKKKKERKLMF